MKNQTLAYLAYIDARIATANDSETVARLTAIYDDALAAYEAVYGNLWG